MKLFEVKVSMMVNRRNIWNTLLRFVFYHYLLIHWTLLIFTNHLFLFRKKLESIHPHLSCVWQGAHRISMYRNSFERERLYSSWGSLTRTFTLLHLYTERRNRNRNTHTHTHTPTSSGIRVSWCRCMSLWCANVGSLIVCDDIISHSRSFLRTLINAIRLPLNESFVPRPSGYYYQQSCITVVAWTMAIGTLEGFIGIIGIIYCSS